MPFCPECGKNVGVTQKFCRSCGASLIEEPPAASAPPAVAPESPLTCSSCGSPLAHDEKFCGICGTKSGEAKAAANATPTPVISPDPAPAPIAAPPMPPQPRALQCRSCGASLTPEMKFCGSCGGPVTIGDPVSPSAPATFPPPPPVQNPLPVQEISRTCKACGNPIRPGDKFCSKCLVRVPEVPSAATVFPAPPPPVAFSPPPPPPSSSFVIDPLHAEASHSRTCKACGNPIKPGDKFCSKCLVRVPEVPSAATVFPAPPPPVAFSPPPPTLRSQPPSPFAADPVPAQVSPTRSCKACGNPIKPGDRFCSKCLVKVPDETAAAPLQAPPPPATPAAPYVCASCGSPISGLEKFCGICGSPVVAARAPTAPSPLPSGKFCGKCGGPISDTTKFCGTCGSPVNATPVPDSSASSSAPAPVASGGEEVVGVIANARKTKLLGADYFNIVVTDRRMILAQMTQPMLNAAIMEAQARAKAEGKGFFAIMKDQMAAQFQFAKRYDTMAPDQALAETAGNRAIPNDRVSAISMKLRDTGSGEVEYTEFKMIIDSAEGKFEFMIGEDDRFINLLKHVYGEKVHMPFGYMRAGGVRIKFF